MRREGFASLPVLPADNATADVQVCEPLSARLTVNACAARYDKHNTATAGVYGVDLRRSSPCCKCKAGRANYITLIARAT